MRSNDLEQLLFVSIAPINCTSFSCAYLHPTQEFIEQCMNITKVVEKYVGQSTASVPIGVFLVVLFVSVVIQVSLLAGLIATYYKYYKLKNDITTQIQVEKASGAQNNFVNILGETYEAELVNVE